MTTCSAAMRAASVAMTILAGTTVETAAADDEALFKARCERCHTALGAADLAARSSPPEARGDWLQTFLRTHHARDDAERQAIIRFLSTVERTH